ncbi:MAG: queuosine precursor transporter [Bacteroidales bacterium]|nr:queuosine precursor transporter [Bacteroidales bacterium]
MNSGYSPSVKRKLFNLYIFLSAFFICNALIAEFIGVKIFNIEQAFGLLKNSSDAGKINMSIGVIIWPFVFLISDLLNEYFGKKGVRRISFITAGLIAYAAVIIYAGTLLPPAQFWLDANNIDNNGNAFNINFAYQTIFRQGVGIVIGSITAFLVSQLIDVYVFHFFRKITGHRLLWVRATGSTIVSQLIDSFLILFIAFYLLGNWQFKDVISVGTVQYLYKVGLAILLTPLIYLAHGIINRYLGSDYSHDVIEKADRDW